MPNIQEGREQIGHEAFCVMTRLCGGPDYFGIQFDKRRTDGVDIAMLINVSAPK